MKKSIYSKYSNERANEFKIRTDIMIDEEGEKFVRKSPITQEAKIHINNIYKSYMILCEKYKNSKISINKCNLMDYELEFEYINGTTLEEELDKLLFKEEYGMLFDKIKEYIESLEAFNVDKIFNQTKSFNEVFGVINLPKSLKAMDVSNIDLVFNNIIVGEKFQMIDYEWTFDFLIPFNYIIYRMIYYYINGSPKRKKLDDLEIYKLLGIKEKEISQYEIMEENFQKYVLGETVPLRNMYPFLETQNINIKKFIDWEESKSYKSTIQIFYDYGDGFSEKESYKIKVSLENEGKINFEIPVNIHTKNIRIDPANYMCIVNIMNILGVEDNYYEVEFQSNGKSLNENFIFFNTIDPQIILKDIKKNTTKIEVEIQVQTISKIDSIQIDNFINIKENNIKELNEVVISKEENIKELNEKVISKEENIKELNEKVISKEENIKELNDLLKNKLFDIDELNKKIDSLSKKLDDIESSRSWKLIKKLKKILGR